MLDPSEIRALLEKQFGRTPTDQQFEYFMADIDVDKDGTVSCDEYIANIFDDKAFLVDGKPHEYRTRGCRIPRTEHRASTVRQLCQLWHYVHQVGHCCCLSELPWHRGWHGRGLHTLHTHLVRRLLMHPRCSADLGVLCASGAALFGPFCCVDALLAAKANVNQAEQDGMSPLFISATKGHGGIVDALLAAKADANQARQDGASPVLFSAGQGDSGIMDALLAAKANVNLAMYNGFSPLHFSAQSGHACVVDALLAANANVNAPMTETSRHNPLTVPALMGPSCSSAGPSTRRCRRMTNRSPPRDWGAQFLHAYRRIPARPPWAVIS